MRCAWGAGRTPTPASHPVPPGRKEASRADRSLCFSRRVSGRPGRQGTFPGCGQHCWPRPQRAPSWPGLGQSRGQRGSRRALQRTALCSGAGSRGGGRKPLGSQPHQKHQGKSGQGTQRASSPHPHSPPPAPPPALCAAASLTSWTRPLLPALALPALHPALCAGTGGSVGKAGERVGQGGDSGKESELPAPRGRGLPTQGHRRPPVWPF